MSEPYRQLSPKDFDDLYVLRQQMPDVPVRDFAEEVYRDFNGYDLKQIREALRKIDKGHEV